MPGPDYEAVCPNIIGSFNSYGKNLHSVRSIVDSCRAGVRNIARQVYDLHTWQNVWFFWKKMV